MFNSFELLKSGGSIILNKSLIHAIGIHESILFADLLSKFEYFSERSAIEEDFFYCTQYYITSTTGLSEFQQRESLKKLISLGLIETKRKGMPSKLYYKIIATDELIFTLIKKGKLIINNLTKKSINENNISYNTVKSTEVKKLENMILRNLTTCSQETSLHDLKKLNLNNIKNNNNKKNNIKNNIKKDKELSSKVFDEENFCYKASELFLKNILSLNSSFKTPDLQKWSKEIDLMIRLDKRKEDDILNIINKLKDSEFWSKVILSTKKLREKYDTLFMQFSNKTIKNSNESVMDRLIKIHNNFENESETK